MTPRIKFIFISTFFMGVLSGAYAYVMFFAPEYGDDGYQTDMLTITAQTYGGCSRGNFCSSFQLRDKGVYQYLSTDDAVMEAGKLPPTLFRNIIRALTQEALTTYAKAQPIRDCVSYVDGIDYAYTISVEENTFKLDTCTTQLPHDSTLQKAFIAAFRYMSNPESEVPDASEPDVENFLIKRFQNN